MTSVFDKMILIIRKFGSQGQHEDSSIILEASEIEIVRS